MQAGDAGAEPAGSTITLMRGGAVAARPAHNRKAVSAILTPATNTMAKMQRSRALRRHHADRHMRRRLSEDRNQHYRDLDCPCWTDPKHMARFKEQPKLDCHCRCCGNERWEKQIRRKRIRVTGRHIDIELQVGP